MPTLEDVAKRAGVSTATVSKVLSNTPYFTENTREKVMRAVKELGYVPNLAARALAAGKTRIIAVIFPYVFEAIFTDPLTMNILHGIEAKCSLHSYNMLLSTPRLTADGADENHIHLVQSGYFDGAIALDSYPVASALKPIHARGIPAVTIGYHESKHWVRPDDELGGQLLMTHVLEFGHRRIGIIAVPEDMHFCIPLRMAGIRAAAQPEGLDVSLLPIAYGDWSIPSGERGAKDLLAEHPDITALVCLNDRMAIGAIQAARELGRHVPRDLTVVGFDNIPNAALFAPPLTTIDQHAAELGKTAARMLFNILAGGNPESIKQPVSLVIRESSAVSPDPYQ